MKSRHFARPSAAMQLLQGGIAITGIVHLQHMIQL